jgi:hypothetical protein
MKRTVLLITLVLSTTLVGAQVNQNLKKFFSMLTTENLNNEKTKIIEINGTVLTYVEYSSVVEQFSNCKVDLANLPQEVRWTIKEEYDELYPEDSATNSDAEHISLLFSTNVVERNPCFNETGTNVKGNTTLQGGMKNYANISFKDSDLASKAKEYLTAYIKDMTE